MERLAESLLQDEVTGAGVGGVEELSGAAHIPPARSKRGTFLRSYRKRIVRYKNIWVFELYQKESYMSWAPLLWGHDLPGVFQEVGQRLLGAEHSEMVRVPGRLWEKSETLRRKRRNLHSQSWLSGQRTTQTQEGREVGEGSRQVTSVHFQKLSFWILTKFILLCEPLEILYFGSSCGCFNGG